MQQLQATTSTDSERESLRQLIEQQTKEFEAKNGQVKTLDIIQKETTAGDWAKSSPPKTSVAATKRSLINQQIIEHYSSTVNLEELAADLGLTMPALWSRAQRLDVTRGQKAHPRIAVAEKRKSTVRKLLDKGDSLYEIANKTGWSESTVRNDIREITAQAAVKDDE